MEEKKYYCVTCKCGHVGGQNHYILINFPIKATSKKEAACIARWIPRCKHHHKDCIRDVNEISYIEFEELMKRNNNDPYLLCKNIQEQRVYDLTERICFEENKVEDIEEKRFSKIGKHLVRNKKKYFKFHNREENYSYAY